MRIPKIIKDQPGYNPEKDGSEYAVAKTKTGGYRLYKSVSGQWMDASLQDVSELSKYKDRKFKN